MVCEECGEETDFVMEDGVEYCAECMEKIAREKQEEKQTTKECPYCKKEIRGDQFLFHISTEHYEEAKEKEK